MGPRWKHPMRAKIAGPTSSGKTVFIRRFLKTLPEMTDPVPDQVIYCYDEWLPMFQGMKGVEFIEGFPHMEKWQGDRRRFINH